VRYEGPIYRPPSEADSLLVQATVGCPHNRCTFCLVYKNIKFKVRPTQEIKEDLEEARRAYGDLIQTIFLPAGNSIAMPTAALADVCRYSYSLFPRLKRITVYGSSQFIYRKGAEGLRALAGAGLGRIHVGLESGDDETLGRIRKGTSAAEQIAAGRLARDAGIELSAYVMLGIAGRDRSAIHASLTAAVINEIQPDFVRLRTFVPKINTPLLEDVLAGRFHMLSPHEVIAETLSLLAGISVPTRVVSDHYTNYVNVAGALPGDREALRQTLNNALRQDESAFRPFFIGTE
jgi:radical SAM superfamily enzyme YgiQ (UPF0313 family)